MARIKHRKIKNLIYSEEKKLNDEEFFTSKEFRAYLQDILDIISNAYDTKNIIRISVNWDTNENAKVACTDSKTLYINAGTKLMSDLSSRAERFEGVLGLMLHETGHLLFTNFQKGTEIFKALGNNHLLMIPDKQNSEAYEVYEKVRDYICSIKNKAILQMICQIWKYLSNSLEDGYVDWRIGMRYPGYKPYLDFINDLCFDSLPTVTEIRQTRLKKQQESPEEPVFMISDFLQYLLMYSRYGFIKGEDREIVKEEAALKVIDLVDWIDFAKEEKNSVKRLMFQSIIFYFIFPFDYIDSLLEKYGNEDTSTVDENCQKELNDVLQNAQSGNGISSTSSNDLSNAISSKQGTPVGDQCQEDNEKNLSDNTDNASEETTGEAETTDSDNEGQGNQEQGSQGSADNQEMIVTEQDEELKIGNTKSIAKKDTGNKEKGLASAEKDMQRVLDKIKKNENLKARENHFESELNAFAAAVHHREIHKGVTCEVKRMEMPGQFLLDAYKNIWPQISPISKRLQGKLKKELEKKRKGSNQHNLYFGRKLETSALVRGDGKCFSKKTLPGNKKEIAVGLLVDESGSMRLADRITHARITSLLLYDFCEKLGLPIAIYGHSAGHPDVLLNAYAEFDSVDKNDRYRIMSMDCSGCNRDGYALRYMADRLLTQNADIKLLFIISDGRPSHRDYSGDIAYEDLASIKKEYYKKGIITIAAAIGDDKDTIEHIYGKEAFLNVSNLEELPTNLISIVKKYL